MRWVVFLCGVVLASGVAAADWPSYSGGLANVRYVSESGITAANVGLIDPAWRRDAGQMYRGGVVVEGDVVYFSDETELGLAGGIAAVDAASGADVWHTAVPGVFAGAGRDVVAGEVIVSGSRDLVSDRARVVAVNKSTGELVWDVIVEDGPGHAFITAAPVFFQDMVIVGVSTMDSALPTCCRFRGSVVALNVATGATLWKRYTIPDDRYAEGFRGASVWGSQMSILPEAGLVFVPTGQLHDAPESVKQCELGRAPADPSCVPADVLMDAVVALHVDSGEIAWVFTGEIYDVWNVNCMSGSNVRLCPFPLGVDYDFPQAPMVLPGGRLAVGQKSGYYWVLDALTGAVRWGHNLGVTGSGGGFMWGSAFDGTRIYAVQANTIHIPVSFDVPNATVMENPFLVALDPDSGRVLWAWELPDDPADDVYYGLPVTVVNDVVLTASARDLYFHRASTGELLRSVAFADDGITIQSAITVVGDRIFVHGSRDAPSSGSLVALALRPSDPVVVV